MFDSKRNQYQRVSLHSDVTSDDEQVANAQSASSNASSQKRRQPIKQKKKAKSFIQYACDKPWTKLHLFYFLVAIVAFIGNGVFYFMDPSTAYIIAGILGIAISTYGMQRFRTLINLKAQVDSFGELNTKFGREHHKLGREVDRIQKANNDLRETHHRLNAAMERNRENLDAFRALQDNMGKLGKQSIAELSSIQQKSKTIEKKWRDEMYQHQSNLLHTVFDKVESQGDSASGITQEQFKAFEEQLPEAYRRRFDKMGAFDKLRGDDGAVEFEHVRTALDLFAEMETDDVDIEFEIKKTPTKRNKADSGSDEGDEDKDEDSDGGGGLYERKLVVTSRTMRSERIGNIGASLFGMNDDDKEDEEESQSDADDDHEAAVESMFGSPSNSNTVASAMHTVSPSTSIDLKGKEVTLRDQGKERFADLLSDQ